MRIVKFYIPVLLYLMIHGLSSQILASPINPKLPSTLNFQPLNVVAAPTTETEWTFEMNHLDMAVPSDHFSGLRARNSDIAMLQYELFHSVLITDSDELNQLSSLAATLNIDVEDAFLHFYDDTTVQYSDGRTLTIKGYGDGSASTLKEARITNYVWSDDRYIYNLKSSLLRQLKGNMYRSILTSDLKPDGIFVDENSPLTSFVPTVTSGGHIREYNNKTASDASTEYTSDMTAAFTAVNEIIGHDGTFGDRYIIPNVAEYVDQFLDLGLHGADGVATEIYIQETQPRDPHLYDLAKQFADAGKIFLTTQGSYDPTIPSASNYNSAMDRHQMFALTEYWIAKQGNSTYYSQYPSAFVALSSFWCKARETDVGVPSDSLYSVWKTGTDSVGQDYTIYKRAYTKALMLCRPKIGWVYDDYTTQCQAYDLGGNYKLLHYDGTLGPIITKIGLAMGEAVTLVKADDSSSSDTTAPVISGVTASSITANTATISWTTDESATGSVDYGTSTSYGTSAALSTALTSQSITLTGLSAGTTYHYRINAVDTSGNTSMSSDYTFTTSSGGTTTSSFIQHWAILGSFAHVDGTGLNVDYIGESTVKPSVGTVTAGKTWTDFDSSTNKLDFYSLFTPNEYASAYLNVYINSPSQMNCQVRIGVDDAAKVFLNGAVVGIDSGYDSADPDTESYDVTLNSGWNQLLIKAVNFAVGWTLYARICDTQGNSISSLAYQVNNPNASGTPNINVAMSADKQTAKVGETITYTVTYKNTGDGTASNAIISADVDSHVSFLNASDSGTYNSTTGKVLWNVSSIAPGASATVTYTVKVL